MRLAGGRVGRGGARSKPGGESGRTEGMGVAGLSDGDASVFECGRAGAQGGQAGKEGKRAGNRGTVMNGLKIKSNSTHRLSL